MSPYFLYFLKYFRDKYGVPGSRSGNMFSRSRNVLKSNTIDQESLISHLGIIKKTLKPPELHSKTKKNRNTTIFCFCRIWGPIRPRLGATTRTTRTKRQRRRNEAGRPVRGADKLDQLP